MVLEDSKVSESGSHAQLLALSGRYARMWQAQSGCGAATSGALHSTKPVHAASDMTDGPSPERQGRPTSQQANESHG